MTPEEAIETLREAIGPRLDRMAVLAREVADLRDWAERSVELLNIGLPPAEHAHIVSAFTGEMGGRCKTCDTHALLAEWDAMKERP